METEIRKKCQVLGEKIQELESTNEIKTLQVLPGSCFVLLGKRRGLRQELLVEFSSSVLQHMAEAFSGQPITE